MKLFRLSGLALAMLPLCLIGVEGVEAAPVDSAVVQKAPYLQTIRWDAEFDVVVAGYGFAGGSAAIAAADAGARFCFLRKRPRDRKAATAAMPLNRRCGSTTRRRATRKFFAISS